MRWPSPQDYREAIQALSVSISDDELRVGELELDSLQLPLVNSGQYAAVFKISGKNRAWAVRCFLHNFVDRQERYKKISQFVLRDDLEYTVDFELIDKGIMVGNDWFPLLKMEYVSGKSLGRYVRENIKDAAKIKALIHQFEDMMKALKRDGIAHGDLQHDNIVVNDEGRLRLIDYDGMFVPDLKGWHSNELGHRNYQHPQRSELDFGPELDNFSAWLIRGALECLVAEPRTHERFLANDEGFLLGREDLISADFSKRLHDLEELGGKCKEFSRQIRTLVRRPCSKLPYLGENLELDKSLRPVALQKLPAKFTKEPEINYITSPVGGVSHRSISNLPIYSLEQLKYSKGDLNCFPSKLIGTAQISPTTSTTKQEIVQRMSENLEAGETIVWSGGLSPMKMSSTQQDFQTGGSPYMVFGTSCFFACFALTIITHFPIFMMLGVVGLIISIGGASGGGNSGGAHQIYALTEKNLKLGINANYRRLSADSEETEADMICVDIPLKQVKVALFHKGSEKLEERVQLQVEVPSKDYSVTEIRSLWLHGFTVKERLALLTRLRSLGVQCSVMS